MRKRKMGKKKTLIKKEKRPLLEALGLKRIGAPIMEGPYGSSKILVAMTLHRAITSSSSNGLPFEGI
jgi:hypothetical protein